MTLRRRITAALLLIAIWIAVELLGTVVDSISFEPTTEALELARHARHEARLWALALFVVGLVATAVSGHFAHLLNVLTALLTFVPGAGVGALIAYVVIVPVDLVLLVLVLVRRPAP